jgi:acetoin utilization deacetylase AcuC-like enzyme
MITREIIKQAIDTLSQRKPELAYTLGEMLAAGRIDCPRDPDDAYLGDDFFFLFDGQPVRIRRYLFFTEASVPVEQRLLLKYGEMFQKAALQRAGETIEYSRAAEQIEEAGQRMLVHYEIDLAAEELETRRKELKKQNAPSKQISQVSQRIEAMLDLRASLPLANTLTRAASTGASWMGMVGDDATAAFVPFPFCMESLMQVAEMNLEFFHPRMLLQLFAKGLGNNVFACISGNQIHGLLFLELKKRFLYQGLEIKYIATRRGGGESERPRHHPEIRGAGMFLVAGAWLLWKQILPEVQEIILDSEVTARRFYEAGGFEPRGMSEYVLKSLSPKLLQNVLLLSAGITGIHRKTVEAIFRSLEKTVRSAQRKRKSNRGKNRFGELSQLLSTCMHPSIHQSVLSYLLSLMAPHTDWSSPIAGQLEAATVLLADRQSRIGTESGGRVPIVHDQRFSRHLENMMHLENPKRVTVFDEVLHHPSLAGKWTIIPPRMASEQELAMVHTPAHIDRIRKSAGQAMTSFDLDTQASENSYETACLAVGGVFNLIDRTWTGPSRRGFAFVRPPGHHAEPDRIMGFCLFNNVALGAAYLKEQRSVDRVLIVDLDAHHGNGTQAAFYHRPDVLFISLHQFPGYPGTGALSEIGADAGTGFTMNVPLGSGSGQKEYTQVLEWLVKPVAIAYQPQMILVSMGFDLYLHDRLGGMRVTPDGYARLTAMLLEIAETAAGGRIVFVMEGGYSLKGIRECGLRVMQEICGIPSVPSANKEKNKSFSRSSVLAKVIDIHKAYWPTLVSSASSRGGDANIRRDAGFPRSGG